MGRDTLIRMIAPLVLFEVAWMAGYFFVPNTPLAHVLYFLGLALACGRMIEG